MDQYLVDRDIRTRKPFHTIAVLLLVSLLVCLLVGSFVSAVKARGGVLVIGPGDEAIEKVQLASPDNVVGNMTVNDGFVDFFVTNPSYDIVYQRNRTSFDSFNFTANESGVYVMHFVNKYQSGDVNVTLGYGINFFFSVSLSLTISPQLSITITRVQPYLNLVVSPMGFPVAGQSWQISVYYQTNSSDETTYYSPLPNATVEVTTIVGGQTKVYNFTTDELGRLEFQFLAEYSDISFQAISGGNRSGIFALTQRAEHYISGDFVDFMFALSAVMSGISAVSVAILHFGKRIRVIFSLLIVVVFCLSMLQLVISVYSKLFLWTPWGYSESIFSFFTWTTLKYASLFGIVLFAVICLLALWSKLRSPKLVVPIK
jgi:hypothetical protein